jgi:septal ring factor EnvC (AmiA/AmiB activator)
MIRKRGKRSVTAFGRFLPVAVAVMAVALLGADRSSKLEKIKEDIRRHQADLRDAESQVSLSLESIHELDQKLESIDETMAELSTEITETSGRMAAVQAGLAEAERDLEAREDELARHLRLVYKMGRYPMVRLLVGADELGDVVRRVRFTMALAREDRRLARAAERKREEIQRDRDALQRELDYLKSLQQLKLEEMRLARRRREHKQEILANARGQTDVLKKRLRQLKKEQAELESLVRSKTGGGGRPVPDRPPGRGPEVLVRHGKIISPTKGRLVRGYGRIKDDRYGTYTQNDGMDIEASIGSEIRSVLKGKVVFADWFRGYGKLIIVDHGSGCTSLYAHLGSFSVGVGERVSEGQLLGLVGETGYVAKPTLHFEIRQDGLAINPEVWVKQ